MAALTQLTTNDWETTRDAIHGYLRVLGRVRRAYTPKMKHWWHIAVVSHVHGWTTGPMRVGDMTVEVTLDLVNHQLRIDTGSGPFWQIPIEGQSSLALYHQLQSVFSELGVALVVDTGRFSSDEVSYDVTDAAKIRAVLSHIDLILKEFKAGFRREGGPVVLWAHHLDLAVLWFSGNLIDGQDPDNEEYADEQMNFGFGLGDDTVNEPYFYITAYPAPEGFRDIKLPGKAYWPETGFGGAVLKYADADSAETVLTFLKTVHTATKALMK